MSEVMRTVTQFQNCYARLSADMLHSCYILLFLLALSTISCRELIRSPRNRRLLPPKERSSYGKVYSVSTVRGGAFNITELLQKSQTKVNPFEGSADVLITTAIGVNMLDRRKKLHLPRNTTILEVKRRLSAKFPGSPPVALQRLFYGERLLDDSTIMGTLSTLSPIVLELDMITGTSTYNRTMAVTQAVEAYVATLVHQTYLGVKLHELNLVGSAVNISNQSMRHESKAYAELFKTLNDSIYEKYGDEIRQAIEAEKEPDVASADTAAWRGGVDGPAPVLNPLAAAMAREFDLNWRGVRHFTYYTAVLLALYFSGATGSASSAAVLTIIPVLWLSKLRQLRILSKIALYLLLPEIYRSEFLRPLLPAPLQVIGQQLLAMEQTDVGKEEEDMPTQRLQPSGGQGDLRRSNFKATSAWLRKLTGRRGTSRSAEGENSKRTAEQSFSSVAVREVGRLVSGLDPWLGADEDNVDDNLAGEEEGPAEEDYSAVDEDGEDGDGGDARDAEDTGDELDLDEEVDADDMGGDADDMDAEE